MNQGKDCEVKRIPNPISPQPLDFFNTFTETLYWRGLRRGQRNQRGHRGHRGKGGQGRGLGTLREVSFLWFLLCLKLRCVGDLRLKVPPRVPRATLRVTREVMKVTSLLFLRPSSAHQALAMAPWILGSLLCSTLLQPATASPQHSSLNLKTALSCCS